MWPWKRRTIVPKCEFSIIRARIDGEFKDLLTYLPTEKIFQEGLDPRAIIGGFINPIVNLESPEEILTAPMINPQNFGRNPVFFEHLQSLVAIEVPKIPQFIEGARQQSDGFLYIIDARTPDPDGDIPLEDIVGAFELRSGKITTESYEPMQSYHIMTEKGLFNLEWLEQPLMRVFYSDQA